MYIYEREQERELETFFFSFVQKSKLMFRVLFIFVFSFWKKRRRVKRDVVLDIIISRSIYIARFCVHRDDDGDTNDAAHTRDDDTVDGRGKGIVSSFCFLSSSSSLSSFTSSFFAIGFLDMSAVVVSR